ncbi:MAG: phosphatase PAP2 family protein [bacterium]
MVFTSRDIALIAGSTVAAAALSRLDTPVARAFSDSGLHVRHPGLTSAANRASRVTETVLMITGGTLWGIARLRHDDGMAAVALHGTESVASAAMTIQVVRGVLGRARPYVVDDLGEKRDGDPYDFEFLHGFTSFNYRSFPSMHAMASMAVASSLAQEMRFRDTPTRRVITPLLYTAAVAPSLARMYLDEHWGSDIVMGMFLGVFAGQKVVMYSRDHPDNRADRTFLKPGVRATVVKGAGGFSFQVTPF